MTTAVETAVRGFSYPNAETNDLFFSELLTTYAHGQVERFLVRHAEALASAGRGYAETIAGAFTEFNFDSFWDASTMRLGEPTDEPAAVLAAFLLHLAGRGLRADWSFSFSRPAAFFWGGKLLSEAIVELSVAGEGVFFDVGFRAATGETWNLTLEPAPSGFMLATPEEIAALPIEQWPARARLSEQSREEIDATMQDALAILAKNAPDYFSWVVRVLRRVVPVYSAENATQSQSCDRNPGVVAISFPARPVAVAEILVHECSHQYYHLTELLGRVTNGSDRREFYSPVKDRERPLEAILLAFHAFANMVFFYRRALASGLEDNGYCAANEARHRADLEQLGAHLESSTGLTALGLALFQPAWEHFRQLTR